MCIRDSLRAVRGVKHNTERAQRRQRGTLTSVSCRQTGYSTRGEQSPVYSIGRAPQVCGFIGTRNELGYSKSWVRKVCRVKSKLSTRHANIQGGERERTRYEDTKSTPMGKEVGKCIVPTEYTSSSTSHPFPSPATRAPETKKARLLSFASSQDVGVDVNGKK